MGAIDHIAHEPVQAVHGRITELLKCLHRYLIVLLFQEMLIHRSEDRLACQSARLVILKPCWKLA